MVDESSHKPLRSIHYTHTHTKCPHGIPLGIASLGAFISNSKHWNRNKMANILQAKIYFLIYHFKGQTNNGPAVIRIMVWRRACDKTLSEPIIAQVTDVYMRQSFNFDLHCRSTSITISQQIVCVCLLVLEIHYNDVIMGVMASQTTSLTIVYSTVYSVAYQSKHQSSASLAFVRGIHRGPVNSPHKWPVTRKMFPFDDVIMVRAWCVFRVWLRFSCVSSKKNHEHTLAKISLQCRDNEGDGVSNQRYIDCLLNPLFGPRWKKTSKLRVTALSGGNSPVTGEHKESVTRKMFPFDDVIILLGSVHDKK